MLETLLQDAKDTKSCYSGVTTISLVVANNNDKETERQDLADWTKLEL